MVLLVGNHKSLWNLVNCLLSCRRLLWSLSIGNMEYSPLNIFWCLMRWKIKNFQNMFVVRLLIRGCYWCLQGPVTTGYFIVTTPASRDFLQGKWRTADKSRVIIFHSIVGLASGYHWDIKYFRMTFSLDFDTVKSCFTSLAIMLYGWQLCSPRIKDCQLTGQNVFLIVPSNIMRSN